MSVRDRHVRHCVVHGRSLIFPFALCPSVIGMFDIVLCVDMCETAGGSARSSKDNLLPELKNNGASLLSTGPL